MKGAVALRFAAWIIAITLVALPVVGVLQGWFASDRWPVRELQVHATFSHVTATQVRTAMPGVSASARTTGNSLIASGRVPNTTRILRRYSALLIAPRYRVDVKGELMVRAEYSGQYRRLGAARLCGRRIRVRV